ncbi:hypothetical protein GCM10028803_55180 [Larkinella knui]|uniref:Cupin domain-containing protein n=1 Tax=Larkinella knui TaxID=2025310 RepID=A0A3P1CG95_9BACT|nr:cupin domain-containing protein [Larkinella knui]RRB12287.1 cupin domain-containing protein [Larkinella knui]
MESSGNQQLIFAQGPQAPEAYFTGTAWIKLLVPAHDQLNVMINNVVFEPGARNNWHTHPGGQILLATDGVGCYQERGKPVQVLHKGDVVQILPDVEHWHGASAEAAFTHIAINTNTDRGIVEWLAPVTDEEYKTTH